MPKTFKLIEDKFSEVENERRWTYKLKITFNYRLIKKATITDHYLVSHKDVITNQLIMELLEEMDGETLEPTKYKGRRKVFKWEGDYNDERYRIIFWFEDNSSDWLWIRDCFPC